MSRWSNSGRGSTATFLQAGFTPAPKEPEAQKPQGKTGDVGEEEAVVSSPPPPAIGLHAYFSL